ncbi:MULTISPECIES: AMP-binding protein [Actinopolyspora]|uniref:Acetyl-CoA synthetase n=1 Tax=Actinopolyspora saharensis TaxID=995062 RepID=A0A1H1AAU3_9ACTN|nr:MULTISPECIES: AMP-binding protein [Actinopolyspora]SDQ36396.1 acetyl-CoA synthetase [Actinopolyspora saharensis]
MVEATAFGAAGVGGEENHDDTATEQFRRARDFLLRNRTDHEAAHAGFRWPGFERFNWALDWFDTIGRRTDRPALWITRPDGGEEKVSYAELTKRSNRVANWLRELGAVRGDRLILMLDNRAELWETLLAAMKLGVVTIPATPLLGPAELRDRVERGRANHVVTGAEHVAKFAEVEGDYTRIAVGEETSGWVNYADSAGADERFAPEGITRADDPLLLYFTSGTTALPKLVEHTHVSYPVGHLSTMYWLGLQPGDVHLNISSPGWAKHAWSCVFAPFNAEATVFVHGYERFAPERLLDEMSRCGVTSFCAPPTVWRMLVQSDLGRLSRPPRSVVSAGEPLNPEVIEQVARKWSVTIRDGFGQTESSVQVANTPGMPVKEGSMGRPLPGFDVALVDPETGERTTEGEICLALAPPPVGLMSGYSDAEQTAEVMRDGYYHTGDVGSVDEDGYITYVGRTDDVFKSSDYRISPFELESVLLQHPAVAEAAVVPAPDPIRLAVPKAYVVLAAGCVGDRDTALSVLRYAREQLAAYKRIRRLQFDELPKTISGKIRRVELRSRELDRLEEGERTPGVEFGEEDFPELKR